ncbi:MAG: hypothetical protein Q7W30_07770 [Coriobacteriia bacterium]|nr:hypothetical protein [Coriobacteriia bacterium]
MAQTQTKPFARATAGTAPAGRKSQWTAKKVKGEGVARIVHAYALKDDEIQVRVISDVHAGAEACDHNLFERDVAWALERRNRYLLTGGDLLDLACKSSVGDTFSQTMNASGQFRYMAQTLRPVAAAGRLVGMVGGNHEDRIYKDSGFDVTGMLGDFLEVPTGDELFVLFHVCPKDSRQTNEYLLYLRHGHGGGGTMGAKANAATRGGLLIPECDVFCSGHTHATLSAGDCYTTANRTTGFIETRERRFVATGTYLGREPYSVKKGFPPALKGSPVITLGGDRRFVSVSF